MWIDSAEHYGKTVTWGTTGNLESILEEAVRYASVNDWSIASISTHMGNNYDDRLVTVDFE